MLNFTYRLQGNTLALHQQVINESSEPMPFAIGLHPYFAVADKSKLSFDIPATELQSHRDYSTHYFNGQFDFDTDEIDVIFHSPSRQTSAVTDGDRHLRLQLSYEPPYSKLVFWTLKGKDFYCLEPWSAPRNAINTGQHLTLLQPGDRLDTQVTLAVAVS